MNLRIAVADDQKRDRDDLIRILCAAEPACSDDPSLIREFVSGEALLAEFQAGLFDVVFLDILMDRINGIETAQTIRRLDPAALIVFLTSSREYAFDAFPVHPFDYLIKPVTGAQVETLIREIHRTLEKEEPTVTVRVSRSDLTVPLARIASVLSQGHSVMMRLTDGRELLAQATFAEMHSQLSGDPRFLLCNRGVLINMDEASSFGEDVITMKDGVRYAIRVRGHAALAAAFSQYQITRMRKGEVRR